MYGRLTAYHENDISGKNASHGMPDEDHISVWPFVRLKPLAELIPGYLNCPICLVAWIELGVDNMCVCQSIFQEIMDMGRKRTK